MAEHRILIVDDDPLIRETLVEALRDDGYEPRAAPDGRAALDVLEKWRADLILLDLMMPHLDGVGFRAEQRRRAALRDIPVLVLSANRRLWVDAARIAPAAVLEKPFDLPVLLDVVADLLSPAEASRS